MLSSYFDYYTSRTTISTGTIISHHCSCTITSICHCIYIIPISIFHFPYDFFLEHSCNHATWSYLVFWQCFFKKKLKLNKKLWGLVFNLLSFILKLKTCFFFLKRQCLWSYRTLRYFLQISFINPLKPSESSPICFFKASQ